MKTTKEMIEVMQAFERGERIEAKSLNNDIYGWDETKKPFWDWHNLDYRVKPNYVPFETAEEFLAAQREHGFNVLFRGDKHAAYINANGIVRLIPSTNISNAALSELEYILKDCIFEDGTPCGKEVEA